jgi:DNA repair protein RadC
MQTDTITLRELTIRYTFKSDAAGEPIVVGRYVSTPADSAALFTTMLQDEATEVFAILCLSTKHRVLAYYEVSRGCLDSTLVHPREVFKAAILANAASIVLAHNHPSGDPAPSPDDMALTRRLVEAGRLIGVDVLDHIVIGDGRYVSFRERGWLV